MYKRVYDEFGISSIMASRTADCWGDIKDNSDGETFESDKV